MMKIKALYTKYRNDLREWYEFSKTNKYLEVWRASREDEKKRITLKRSRFELEFLPAALEVIETPPSPTARITTWLVIGVFVTAIIWATLSKTDVVVTAVGKIVPSGKTKVIQPFDRSIVQAIHVVEGQRVKKGEILIELDPTDAEADREKLERTLKQAELDILRLNALVADPAKPEDHFKPAEGALPEQIDTQKRLMAAQSQEYLSRNAALENAIEASKADAQGTESEIRKLQQTIPLIRQRSETSSALAYKGLAIKTQALELQQQLVEAQQTLVTQRHRLEQLNAAIAQAREQRKQQESEFKRERLNDLRETQDRVEQLKQEVIKAKDYSGQRRLESPIDGFVQALAVTTVNAVVNPAQELMFIVPADEPLEVEAMLLNQDRGSVQEDDTAEVKIDAFPFTRYGVVDAKVTHISNDSIQDEKLGPIFKINASMAEKTLLTGANTVHLKPGMAVTLEVKTDERRVIEFLLSPIIKGFDEAARER